MKKQEKSEISAKKETIKIPNGLIVVVLLAIVLAGGYFIFQDDGSSEVVVGGGDQNTLPPNSAAAIVNGEKITVGELDAAYNSLPPQYKSSMDKKALLNQLVQTKIIYQEAVKNGALVSPEEVEEEFKQAKQLSGLSDEEIATNLASQGLTEGDLLDQYAKQKTIQNYLDVNFLSLIEVSDEEIERFYEDNSEQFEIGEQVRVRHILIGDADLSEDERKTKAMGLLPGLTEENFCDNVKEYSTDTASVEACGEYIFGLDDPLDTGFKTLSFAQDEGDMGIVQSQFGSHIIWTVEKIPGSTISLEDAREEIENAIKNEKGRTGYQAFYDDISQDSVVEIKI